MSAKNRHVRRRTLNTTLRIESLERRLLLTCTASTGSEYSNDLHQEEKLVSIVPDGTLISRVANDGSNVDEQPSVLFATLDTVFGSREAWIPTLCNALDVWNEVAGVHLKYVDSDDGAALPLAGGEQGVRGHIRIGGRPVDGPNQILGYNPPGSEDVVLDTDLDPATASLTRVSYVLMHELGHALGLVHSLPNNGSKLMEEYEPVYSQPSMNAESVEAFRKPQFDDVAQIQREYGDNLEPNNTPAQSFDLGRLPQGTTRLDTLSIDSAGDVDYFQFEAGANQQVTIRLQQYGDIYPVGSSPETIEVIRASERNDLRLELRDENGLLAASDSASVPHVIESVENYPLGNAGLYRIAVSGENNQLQTYRLIIEIGPQTGSGFLLEGDVDELRNQVQAANAGLRDTQIILPAGHYRFSEPIVVTGRVEIQGAGTASTLFDGQHQTRLFDVRSGGSLTLSNATLARGRVTTKWDRGAAIYAYRSDLHLEDVVLVENFAQWSGGAIHVSETNTTLHRVTAAFNSTNSSGGAIHVANSPIAVTESHFTDNTGGGGISIFSDQPATIRRSVVARNESGIHGVKYVSPIALDLDNSNDVERIFGQFQFDLDGDGSLDNLDEWYGPNEGILIETSFSDQVTGEHVFGDYGRTYPHGYQKLSFRDADSSGYIEGLELQGLAIWIDANSNAALDVGEQHTLAELGISALSTSHLGLLANAIRTDDSTILQASYYVIDSDCTGINCLSGANGGGISVGGGGSFTITNSWITDNSAGYGGGIDFGAGTLILDGLHFERNRARSGGGLRTGNGGDLTVSNSLFQQNEALNGAGIALWNGEIEIHNSWLRENRADSSGGGIAILGGVERVLIRESTISENRAIGWSGGGIRASDGAQFTLLNSTISNNRASSYGAGIATIGAFTKADILSSTIVYNYQELDFAHGGGVHAEPRSSATLTNTVVANNTTGGKLTDIHGDILLSHSFVGIVDEDTALAIDGSKGNLVGTAFAPLDPSLGVLSSNGGSTPSHRTLPGSPLVDAGIALGPGSIDQRGFPRQDGMPDIGAFEQTKAPNFNNLPPTLSPFSGPIFLPINTPPQVLPIQGISDGNAGLQSVLLAASSDNPALVDSLSAQNQSSDRAELRLTLHPNASGQAKLSVKARDPGLDLLPGTLDDLMTQRSVDLLVTNGVWQEAEDLTGTSVVRPQASGGATLAVANGEVAELQWSSAGQQALKSWFIRYNNLNEQNAVSLSVSLDGQSLATEMLQTQTSRDTYHYLEIPADLNLSAGSHNLQLRVTGASTPVEFDVITSQIEQVPALAIHELKVLEPLRDSQLARFKISLSSPSNQIVSVNFQTEAASASTGFALATAGEDYEPTTQQIVFLPGQTTQWAEFEIYRDYEREIREVLQGRLTQAINASIAVDRALAEIFDNPVSLGNPNIDDLDSNPDIVPGYFIDVDATGPFGTPPPYSPPPIGLVAIGDTQMLLSRSFRLSDVNQDGVTSAIDALFVITHLNGQRNTLTLDVNRDGHISPVDALLVIVALNNLGNGEGELAEATSEQLVGGWFDATTDNERRLRRNSNWFFDEGLEQ